MKNKIQVLVIDAYRTRMYFLFAMIWLLLIIVAFTCVSIVNAHSAIVKSEPQDGEILDTSPDNVTAWFSEEVDSEFSTIRVFDSQNNQVDNGDGCVDLNDLDHLSMIVSLPPLQSGTYTVQWAVLSADDGDPTQGEFTFSVSNGAAPSESSPSSGLTPPVWFVGGLVILLVFVVLIWFFFIRRKTSG